MTGVIVLAQQHSRPGAWVGFDIHQRAGDIDRRVPRWAGCGEPIARRTVWVTSITVLSGEETVRLLSTVPV